MDIIIKQADLERFCINHVKQSFNLDGKSVSIQFKTGRKRPSFAVVTICEKGNTAAMKPVEAPKMEEKGKTLFETLGESIGGGLNDGASLFKK